jgi:hypothetical protein
VDDEWLGIVFLEDEDGKQRDFIMGFTDLMEHIGKKAVNGSKLSF